MSNVGKNLEPTNSVDRFGQINSAEKDLTKGGSPSAIESVNAHVNSDVDASRKSQHHTLGRRNNQAAPGNHVHDGINGTKLGLYQMDPANTGRVISTLSISGPKGGNAAVASIITLLKNFIDFTDNTTA